MFHFTVFTKITLVLKGRLATLKVFIIICVLFFLFLEFLTLLLTTALLRCPVPKKKSCKALKKAVTLAAAVESIENSKIIQLDYGLGTLMSSATQSLFLSRVQKCRRISKFTPDLHLISLTLPPFFFFNFTQLLYFAFFLTLIACLAKM